ILRAKLGEELVVFERDHGRTVAVSDPLAKSEAAWFGPKSIIASQVFSRPAPVLRLRFGLRQPSAAFFGFSQDRHFKTHPAFSGRHRADASNSRGRDVARCAVRAPRSAAQGWNVDVPLA